MKSRVIWTWWKRGARRASATSSSMANRRGASARPISGSVGGGIVTHRERRIRATPTSRKKPSLTETKFALPLRTMAAISDPVRASKMPRIKKMNT